MVNFNEKAILTNAGKASSSRMILNSSKAGFAVSTAEDVIITMQAMHTALCRARVLPETIEIHIDQHLGSITMFGYRY